MNITIKVEASELVESLNNLSTAVGNLLAARAETRAEQAADSAIIKAKKIKPAATQEPPSTPAEPISAAEAKTSEPAPTHDALRRLAATKAKKVGAGVIRGLIADMGHDQIADIEDPVKLAKLATQIEAL